MYVANVKKLSLIDAGLNIHRVSKKQLNFFGTCAFNTVVR